MSASDFRHLMSRFYEAAIDVLIENDALLDKFVGDQAIGLFVPGIAGPEHARRAIDAAGLPMAPPWCGLVAPI